MFCSDSCRAQAFVQYHRIECQIMNNLKSKIFDMESKLALRMLMIATQQGKDLKKLSEHPVYQIPFNPSIRSVNKRHFQEDYYHIHHLESHERNLKNFDLIHFCYKAAILIDLLRWTTFFERTRDFTEVCLFTFFTVGYTYRVFHFCNSILNNIYLLPETIISY